METYDDIGESYKEWTLSSLKRSVSVDYTYLKCIGDVHGNSVLDLACGEGHYCRSMKLSGAAQVVGVDISAKMIELARKEEKRVPLGIIYECCDVMELPEIGKFDIVIASLLLHYSKTKDELLKMCRHIYENLKENGRLIGLNSCPDKPLQPYKKYDSTRTCDGPVMEGGVIKITLYRDGRPACSFDNYHWEKRTYEYALKAAEFEDVKWHGIMVSKEGVEKFDPGFWKDYIRQPGLAVFECRKPRDERPR